MHLHVRQDLVTEAASRMLVTGLHQALHIAEAQAKEIMFITLVLAQQAEVIIPLMAFPLAIMHHRGHQEAQAALIRRLPEASLTILLRREVTHNRAQGSHTVRLREHTASLLIAHHPEVTALLRAVAVVAEQPALLQEGRDNSSNCA